MFKGYFNTAYLQREIPIEVVVVSPDANPLHVGQLVVLEPADADTPAYVRVAPGTDKTTVLTNATHIIAQSDMTMGDSHVPVEQRDYRYSDAVAATVLNGATPTATSPKKHIALFAISESQKYTDVTVKEV